MIAFSCPHCTTDLLRSDREAGQEIECPVCKKPVQVPVLTSSALQSLRLPWYYLFLEFFAVALVIISAVAALVIIYRSLKAKQFFWGLLQGGLTVFGALASAALIKLFLDMGRSLRDMRHRSGPRSG